MAIDYTSVTEITGYNVTREQLQRIYTRYRYASEFCKGKEVLEVACGSGQGLGYLARCANRVVGGDYDEKMLKLANNYYDGRVELQRLDAHNLPFHDNCFDVVILYEAIYYLEHPEKFVNEAYRVLRKGGVLIICSANKDWSGFNPSPHSYRYLSAPELYLLLHEKQFDTELFGDCPVSEDTMKGNMIGIIKAIAVKLHLIPKTMKGKELLKRVFHGKLFPLPPEINDDLAAYNPPVSIAHDLPSTHYKVLFAVGYVR